MHAPSGSGDVQRARRSWHRGRLHARFARQRGVAIVTALLLTTLAITIVASLFWQQQVQVRSIENQRLQLQKQWVLRGALDWARLILREDARTSATDDLNEPWAVPLSDTRLDRYVESASIRGHTGSAVLSGAIQDAQARLNLTGLASRGEVNATEVRAFERLLVALRQDPGLAMAAAQQLAATQRPPGAAGAPRPMAFVQVDDLLAVPGFTPAALAALRHHVVFLPRATPVNVNTAPAEVLAARLPALSLAEASALIDARRTASFRDLNDFAARLPGRPEPPPPSQVAVATSYFLVNGRVTIGEASLQVQGLVERHGPTTHLVWLREV